MCKKKEIIPNSCNVQSLVDFLLRIIRPLTNEEHEFFEKATLMDIDKEDCNPNSHIEPRPGEPGLHFHEFIFLLSLIALNQSDPLSPIPYESIEKFYILKLGFDPVPQEGREYKTFD